MSDAPKASADFATISEIIRTARQRMAPSLWDHASGGVETETTLRRNRLAFETIAFKPRLLRGFGGTDMRTTLFGHTIDSPVLLAPVGSIAKFTPNGALAVAKAAAKRRTAACIGTLSWPGLTEVAQQADTPLMFQIYVRGDRDWLREIAAKTEAAGYIALVVSADSNGQSIRDRDLHNRHRQHDSSEYPNLPASGGPGREHMTAFCWDDFDWLRSITRMPLLVKGVMTAEDAILAVEHGADGVYVSNHGGRELDHLPSSIEVLPEIAQAVQGRAEILVDSGFLRGTDVVKAMALGARAVLLGKLQVWAVAAGGEPALERALEIVDHEILEALQLLGVRTWQELNPSYLRPATPTRASLSDWNTYEPTPLPRM